MRLSDNHILTYGPGEPVPYDLVASDCFVVRRDGYAHVYERERRDTDADISHAICEAWGCDQSRVSGAGSYWKVM